MAANIVSPWIVVSSFLIVAFSGCLADEAAPSSSNTSTATTAAATLDADNSTLEPLDPPVANFTVGAANATETEWTVGTVLYFDASSSADPENGNLTFTWDFGDGNGTGEGSTVNYSYAAEGNFTVNLTVTSSASNLSAQSNQTLTIMAAAPAIPPEAKITDPSGDALANYLDLRSVAVKQDETHLIITVGLGAVQPGSSTDTIFLVHFTLNKVEFEIYSYGNGGLKLYDVTNGATVTGVVPRLAGTGYETRIPFEVLEAKKLVAPFAVYAETWVGEGLAGGLESDDRAPNTGSFTYG